MRERARETDREGVREGARERGRPIGRGMRERVPYRAYCWPIVLNLYLFLNCTVLYK